MFGARQCYTNVPRAVDLGGPSVYQGGPKCEIKHKATVFKRVNLLIGGAKHVDWGASPLAPALNVPKAEHQLGDRPGVGKLFNNVGHTNSAKLQAGCNLQ